MGSARREEGTFLSGYLQMSNFFRTFAPILSYAWFNIYFYMDRLAGMRACFRVRFVKCTLQIISNYNKFLQILSNYLHISNIFCNFAPSFKKERHKPKKKTNKKN